MNQTGISLMFLYLNKIFKKLFNQIRKKKKQSSQIKPDQTKLRKIVKIELWKQCTRSNI